jgi:hypothetical protein
MIYSDLKQSKTQKSAWWQNNNIPKGISSTRSFLPCTYKGRTSSRNNLGGLSQDRFTRLKSHCPFYSHLSEVSAKWADVLMTPIKRGSNRLAHDFREKTMLEGNEP